jgi:Zn-dependent peptidase ImmA (M78 family)/transcriptional regulator with XRE-family HTH domain
VAASIPSHASPVMLVWARKQAHLSLEEAARQEGFTVEQLSQWENDERSPSLAQLRRLANRYKRPLMVFYLQEPPTEFSVVRDFRLLPAGVSREYSESLRLALRNSQERQAWASSYLQDLGEPICQWVSSVKLADNTDTVAASLRRHLNVTLPQQTACTRDTDAFALWKRAVEDLGIFVFQSSGVDVKEMRGFALTEKYAPTVVVNSRDAPTAKTFTLIHEVVHILLGVSVITGGRTAITREPQQKIERFCNAVTCEVLIPAEDLRRRVPQDWHSRDSEVVTEIAKQYRVSRLAVALRLVETNFATRQWLDRIWRKIQGTQRKPPKGGPVPHYRALSRYGSAFSRLALSAYETGAIHGGELSQLLKLRLKYLPPLIGELYPNRLQASA